MRYVAALAIAALLTALFFVGGARIAVLVSGPERDANDFTTGARFDLCGHSVDSRFAIAGYDLKQWRGERCRALSTLDRCLLACLEKAATVEIAEGCYPTCVNDAR